MGQSIRAQRPNQCACRRCHRQTRGGGGTTLAPRLHADCTVDLITIHINKPA